MPGRKKTIPVTAAEGPKKTRRPRKKAAMDTVEKAIVNEAAVSAEEEKGPTAPAASQEVPVSEKKENEPKLLGEEKPKKKRTARKKKIETEAAPATVSEDKPKRRGRKKKAEVPAVGDAAETVDVKAETVAEITEEIMPEPEIAPEPKEEKKPAPKKRKNAKPTVIIQSLMGGELTVEEITDRVVKAAKTKDVRIWIKTEENRAYYTVGTTEDAGGYIVLWKE